MTDFAMQSSLCYSAKRFKIAHTRTAFEFLDLAAVYELAVETLYTCEGLTPV